MPNNNDTPTPAERVTKMTGRQRKDARAAVKKTQLQVAIECGTSPQVVRQWEVGVTPQPANAEKYAKALGLEGGAA